MLSIKRFLTLGVIIILNGCYYDAIQPLKEPTWEIVPLNYPSGQLALGDIYFSTGLEGYMLANAQGLGRSLLLKTKDGGNTWQLDTVRLKDISVGRIIGLYNNELYIEGYSNKTIFEPDYMDVFKSGDGGFSWMWDSNGGEFFYPDYFISEAKRLRFAYDKMLMSSDHGTTWSTVSTGPEAANISGANFPSENTGYIYGQYLSPTISSDPLYGKGFILKTSDSGNSWRKLNLDVSGVSSVYFINDLVGFAFTLSNELFKTANGGDSWVKINSSVPLKYGMMQSYFSSARDGYFTSGSGVGGAIYHTSDGGTTWVAQYSHPDEVIQRVYFFSSSKAFAIINSPAGWNIRRLTKN